MIIKLTSPYSYLCAESKFSLTRSAVFNEHIDAACAVSREGSVTIANFHFELYPHIGFLTKELAIKE